jgi:ATP-dependent DNA ligase
MLASQGHLPSDEDGWTAEVKWDGVRAQVREDGRDVTVRSRRCRDCTVSSQS